MKKGEKAHWLVAAFAALVLGWTAIGVLTPSSSGGVPRAAAADSNCQRGGEAQRGGHYAGYICFSRAPTGGGYWVRLTCEYYWLWSYHTYTVQGSFGQPPVYPGQSSTWAWTNCGNHGHQPVDYIIHMDVIWSVPNEFGTTVVRQF